MKKHAIALTLALALPLAAVPVAASAAPVAASTSAAVHIAPSVTVAASAKAKVGVKMKATTALNLRASHSASSRIITVLKKGTVVTPKSASGAWTKVTVKGKTGWVHSGYLKKYVAPKKKASSKAHSPAAAKAIAKKAVAKKGWSTKQYGCLVKLWSRESGWRVKAGNVNGSYGIPQAYPGSKMKSKGSDWRTNASTQIAWGLSYIKGRYGTPCKAWASSESRGWY